MNFILYAIYAVLIVGPIYLVWAIFNINSKMKKVSWLNSQEYAVLRIDVPRNNDKSPLAAEQMFAAIHGIYSDSARYQNHLSFEIVSKDKFIQFYIYVPVHLKDFVEGQIYAQYPTVEIKEVEDYVQSTNIATKNYAICDLNLNKPDVYPIKQFTDFEVDPISGITSVMSKLNQEEEIWFQLVIRPVGDRWQEKGHKMIAAVRSGTKFTGKGIGAKIGKVLFKILKTFFAQLVSPGTELDSKPAEIKLHASVEEALKGIEQKITKLGFETKIRLMSIGDDPVSVRMRCQNVAAAFKQYNTTNLNGFRVGDIYVNDQSQWRDYAYRSFEHDGEMFNIAELASIYHFPHSSVSTPSIVWSGSKKGEPPANLPMKENTPEEELTIIGETNFRNAYKTFGIKKDDRRRHIYIVGKSGTGKSTLIENMAVNDVCAGRGVIVVDPHGELADKVLACIPDDRINDVVVFDPSDREFPVAFNLLEHVDEDFKSLVASGFVGIFKKIFGESWGPRLEHILRNTVLALLDFPDATMLDIPRMLTNTRFREKVVEKVTDPIIKEFWLNEFASFDSKFRTEAVAPILNKVGQFLSSATIRNIVGQPKSTINIREIMDQKKILVVNLSRGKIGEDNSALLGAMMVTKVQLAAMSRADTTVENRPDSYFYVDEFQNFATGSFAVILSEARKYNLNLTMAHQYIAQLSDEVREAVFGNAGTLISFRVGGADADVLVKDYAPVFEQNDLVNLDKHQIYVKLLIDGISSPAFSARTLPPVQKLSGNLDPVVKHSHEIYSTARADVQEMIAQRSHQEEEELRQESELFKKGGLEALLLRKDPSTSSTSTAKPFSASEPEFKRTPVAWIPKEPVVSATPRPSVAPTSITVAPDITPTAVAQPTAVVATPPDFDPEEGSDEPKIPREPKVIKYDNILFGKIYKERTARGGVKWYLGEEVDEEKLAKSNTILDDAAKKLIELTSKSKPVAQKVENRKEKIENREQKIEKREERPEKREEGIEKREQRVENRDEKIEDTEEKIEKAPVESENKTEEKTVEKEETEKAPEIVKVEEKQEDGPRATPAAVPSSTQASAASHMEEGQSIKLSE